MLLILARHGNTFGPTDKVTWVGGDTDLPLVAKGIEQGLAMGAALLAQNLVPTLILTGPLQRTRQTAALVQQAMGQQAFGQPIPVQIAPRLREISYGAWEDKSTAAINAMGPAHAAALAAWEHDMHWPDLPGWGGSAAGVLADLTAVMELLAARGGVGMVVSSNGLFRLLAKHLHIPTTAAKVGTGCLCLLGRNAAGAWQVGAWNLQPTDLTPARLATVRAELALMPPVKGLRA